MGRTPTTVRLSDAEKRLIGAAAARHGISWSTYLRERALEAAADELEDADASSGASGE